MSRGITLEQNQMIELRMQGRAITDISGIIHKSRQTIYTWLDLPEIKEEIQFRKEEMKKTAKDKIASEVNQCITNLIDMANNNKDPRVRFQANKYILDQCLGSPGTAREEKEITNANNDAADMNSLLEELEHIKTMRLIK